jgi:hypothetical protein
MNQTNITFLDEIHDIFLPTERWMLSDADYQSQIRLDKFLTRLHITLTYLLDDLALFRGG